MVQNLIEDRFDIQRWIVMCAFRARKGYKVPMANKPSPSSTPVILVWLRRDLRLNDQTALSEALRDGRPVLPVFIFDPLILSKLEDRDDRRVLFIHQELLKMRTQLEKRGSTILVENGEPTQVFESLARVFKIAAVYTNHDYEPYARSRDEKVRALLAQKGIEFRSFKDQVVFEKLEVQKEAGGPYTVFTPFSRKWLANLEADDLRERSVDTKNFIRWQAPEILSLSELGFRDSSFDFPSAAADLKIIKAYAESRNFPAVRGTTRLGIHLRFGTLSPRELVRLAKGKSETWLSELIWREFFMQILWNFPHVVEGPFRPEYGKIKFRHDDKEFERWCVGETGYPIVDAGMRELNETGFMHNRVRMIAASFLVKHLLIDWRWGEAYFARRLLDFDLSANNGNWQWVAGSGCDAAPYFRVFNPETQMRKFDPRLEYVKRWVPEFGTARYPEPMIDHVTARVRVLRAYEAVLKKKSPSAD